MTTESDPASPVAVLARVVECRHRGAEIGQLAQRAKHHRHVSPIVLVEPGPRDAGDRVDDDERARTQPADELAEAPPSRVVAERDPSAMHDPDRGRRRQRGREMGQPIADGRAALLGGHVDEGSGLPELVPQPRASAGTSEPELQGGERLERLRATHIGRDATLDDGAEPRDRPGVDRQEGIERQAKIHSGAGCIRLAGRISAGRHGGFGRKLRVELGDRLAQPVGRHVVDPGVMG